MGDYDVVLAGERLRRWRAALDLSGPEAATLAGLRWDQLRDAETGATEHDEVDLAVMAGIYGHSVADLLGPPGDEDRPARAEDPADERSARLRHRSPFRPRGSVPDATDEWHLRPGDRIRRTDLHKRYGGSARSGISPCRQSDNVLIFSDPSGAEHGYYDRWDDENGLFLYCGEGQTGDQTLDKGNGAILNHRREHRALRVFEGSGGVVVYAGEFEVSVVRPYIRERSHESGGSAMRTVVMFRLVPLQDR